MWPALGLGLVEDLVGIWVSDFGFAAGDLRSDPLRMTTPPVTFPASEVVPSAVWSVPNLVRQLNIYVCQTNRMVSTLVGGVWWLLFGGWVLGGSCPLGWENNCKGGQPKTSIRLQH